MKKIYDFIGKAEFAISKIALTFLTVLIFSSAIARTLRYPISWAVDLATFLFAWCVFLGGDIAIRNDKLVSIDVLTSRLPKKAQFYLKLFNQAVIVIFLAALIGYGLYLSYTTRIRTFQGIPGLSYTWVTLSVPIGSLLMMCTTILKMNEQWKQGPETIQQTKSKEFI